MFFTYHQNNPDGTFHYDYDKGISVYVIVGADDYLDANRKAEEIGIVFDDERWWSAAGNTEGKLSPELFGSPAAWYLSDFMLEDRMVWEGFIHYQEGRHLGFANSDGTPGIEVDEPKPKATRKPRVKKVAE